MLRAFACTILFLSFCPELSSQEQDEPTQMDEKLYAESPEEAGHFGASIARSGNHLLVRGRSVKPGTGSQYRISAYSIDGTNIEYLHDLSLEEPFDTAVIDSDRCAVGAIFEDVDGNSAAGRVYIFDFDSESNEWSETASIADGDPGTNGFFGTALALVDDMLVVGDPYHDSPGPLDDDEGRVLVYEESAEEWELNSELDRPEGGYRFGGRVAIQHENCILASYEGTDGETGAVFVFELDTGDDEWVETQTILPSGDLEHERFGAEFQLHDDSLFVASPGEETVFEFQLEDGAWIETSTITGTGRSFGWYVEAHGDVLVVGDHDYFGGSLTEGIIYVFRHTGTTWEEQERLVAAEPEADNGLGWRCRTSFAEGVLLAGAPYDDGEEDQGGAVCIHEVEDPDFTIHLPIVQGEIGCTAQPIVSMSNSAPVEGYSWGVCHESEVLAVEEVVGTDSWEEYVFESHTVETLGDGWTVSAVLSTDNDSVIDPTDEIQLYVVTYALLASGSSQLTLCSSLGDPGVDVELLSEGETVEPFKTVGQVTVVPHPPEFLRGDVDSNGEVFGMLDALFLLKWGFIDGPRPDCLDAADVDDNGFVFPIVDAVFLLNWALLEGDAPPSPGPSECGLDPADTTDLMDCASPPDTCFCGASE